MSSPPFPCPPPFKFDDLKKYLNLEVNCYSMVREANESNSNYESMTSEEKNRELEYIIARLSNKSYIIAENKYPYWIERGLIHKIIWVNNKFKKYIIPEKIAIEHLLQNNYKDYVLFCNSSRIKSIPSIAHYHVIYRI